MSFKREYVGTYKDDIIYTCLNCGCTDWIIKPRLDWCPNGCGKTVIGVRGSRTFEYSCNKCDGNWPSKKVFKKAQEET